MVRALTLALLWVAGVSSAGPSAPPLPPQFRACFATGDTAFLLDANGSGTIYVQRGTSAPSYMLSFRTAAGARATTHSPSGLTLFGKEWWVADGSRRLYGFGADGRPTRVIQIPVPAFDVFASGNRLYVYDALPDTSPTRFWFTTDLKTFSPVPLPIADTTAPERTRMLAVQLVLAPTGDGGFCFIHAIGEPTATRVRPNGQRTVIALAYRRTRSRAQLVAATGESDIERYSAPARHAVATERELYVLRNREDVEMAGGREAQQGRRVDRYDAQGRLIATAQLPTTGRWILRADAQRVVVATVEGSILTAPFAAPQPGQLLAD